MKVFPFLLFLLLALSSFADQKTIGRFIEIEDVIEEESIKIFEYETQNNYNNDFLRLHVERGISYFFNEEYEKALSDFNYVIEIEQLFGYKDILATA